MKDLKERMSEVSSYLQRLKSPDIFPEVQKAVTAKDKDLLISLCRRVGIPEVYISILVALLLALPMQIKYPFPL